MSADRAPHSRRRMRRQGVAALLVLSVNACSWFTDFREQPKFDPWESPHDSVAMRGNPQNSVSVYGSAAPAFVVSHARLPGTLDSLATLANPVPPDARSLANGRKYYTINCAVCHGFTGNGDGAATRYGMPGIGIGAGSNAMNALSDGYIWGMIRNGRGLMPSYDRIEEMDRWDVVNYIRGLQGRYRVATGPVGLPGETGDKVPGPSQMGPTRPSPYYKHVGSQADATMGAARPTMGSTVQALVSTPVADSARRAADVGGAPPSAQAVPAAPPASAPSPAPPPPPPSPKKGGPS